MPDERGFYVGGGAPGPTRPQGRGRPVASVVAIVVLATAGYVSCGRSAPTSAVSAEASRFALAGDDTTAVTEVTRESQPDVYYHVTLADAPVGEALALDCEWLDPSGRPTRVNHYQTRTISAPRWNTHCHQRFGPDAPIGLWTVRMTVEGRPLSSGSFSIK